MSLTIGSVGSQYRNVNFKGNEKEEGKKEVKSYPDYYSLDTFLTKRSSSLPKISIGSGLAVAIFSYLATKCKAKEALLIGLATTGMTATMSYLMPKESLITDYKISKQKYEKEMDDIVKSGAQEPKNEQKEPPKEEAVKDIAKEETPKKEPEVKDN